MPLGVLRLGKITTSFRRGSAVNSRWTVSPPEGHNLQRRVKVKFLNYEVALDFAKEHPDATIKLDGKSYIVNGCINCNALTADGEDWCSRCKEVVNANKEVNEAIFAATGVII